MNRGSPKLTGTNRASIEAYYGMIAGPKLGEQQRKIVAFLARNGHRDWTRSEIADALQMRVASVCGRVNELVAERTVVEGERRACGITGTSAHRLSLAPAQMELI